MIISNLSHLSSDSQAPGIPSPLSVSLFPESPREPAICHQVPRLHECQGCFGFLKSSWGHAPALLAGLALQSSLLRTMCSSMLFAFSLGSLNPNGYSFPTSSLLPPFSTQLRHLPLANSQACSVPVTDRSAGLASQARSPPAIRLTTQTPRRIFEWPFQATSKMGIGIWI